MESQNTPETPENLQRRTPRRQHEPATFAALLVLMDQLPSFTVERWQEMEKRHESFSTYGTFDPEDSELIQALDWATAIVNSREKYAKTDVEFAGFLRWKSILHNININHPMAPSEMQLFTNFQKFETFPELKMMVERWLREG